MLRKNWKTAAFTLAGLGLMTPAQGDQIADMQAQIDSLRAELSQVKVDQGDNWLNERRAEEVKGLIMEVLSDADTRASLLGDGATAGYGEHGFFIMSPDNAFALYISGQLQFRYIWNNQDTGSPGANPDEDEGGFQTRRAKIKFNGHISSPKIGYHLVLAHERTNGNTFLEEYDVNYQVNDNLQVAGGLMKLPFLREELISSTRQLAVERSSVNEFFTLNRGEGVRLRYDDGPVLINFMLSDGANSGPNASTNGDFNQDKSELALTGRVDYLVQGDRSQGKDFRGWSGEEQFLNFGVAYHLEYGDARNGGTADFHAYTIDAQWENGPYNAYLAYIGASTSPDSGAVDNRQMNGLVLQGGVDIDPDKVDFFGRWGYIDGDVRGESPVNIYTAGFNYYINGHQTKFTTDVVWLDNMLPAATAFGANPASTGLGLISGTDNELAVRSQIQVLF